MNPRSIALFGLLLLALSPVPVHAFGSISVAVKRGQTEVDPKTLPFAAFTITMENGSLPLANIVLTDVATGKEIIAKLEYWATSDVDYLTALESKRRMHAQIILALKPGEYELKQIEFNPSNSRQIGEASIALYKIAHYRFKVQPKVVNYCGSLCINTNWGKLRNPDLGNLQRSVTETFDVSVAIEQTQQRDLNWAADVIPAMRKLPSVVSPIVKK